MQRSLLGPQPDGTYHFAQRAISADLYQDIIGVGGKLVTREGAGVNYFKIPYRSEAQREVVDAFVGRWAESLNERYPMLVTGEAVRFVGPAIARLGGTRLNGPDGNFVGFVMRELDAPAAPAAERFRLAQHIAGIAPDHELAMASGLHAMTDRNAIFVRDELKKQFGTYYDRSAKALIFVPDSSLDPKTAERDFLAAEGIVREARNRNPQEFDRLRLGLQIAIEAGLGPEIFKDEVVNSLDDLVALDFGRIEYQDAFNAARQAYRQMVAADRESAVVIDSEPAYTLDAAINSALGKERDAIGLESQQNVALEQNRDRNRSVGAAAYRASDDLLRIAERFTSNVLHADGRMTDSEHMAEAMQKAVDRFDAKDVALYTVAKNTVSYGPMLARDGDRFVQLMAVRDHDGVRAELVTHDRRALVRDRIEGKEHESASIGHLLNDATLDRAIAEKTSVALVSHGGVTFALSASKLGVAQRELSAQALEAIFAEAVTHELASLSPSAYFATKSNAEHAAGMKPVPPVVEIPPNASALERAKAERAAEVRSQTLESNRVAMEERRVAETRLVEDAKMLAGGIIADKFGTAPQSLTVRGPAHNRPMTAELVGVFANGDALMFAELVEKVDDRGFKVRVDNKPVFEVPLNPKLTIVDAREHVRIRIDDERTQSAIDNPYVYMQGTNRDNTPRDATPLTVGVSRGEIVTSKLVGANMQALLDRGYTFHQTRQPKVKDIAAPETSLNLNAELGKSGKPGSFDSDRESEITKLEVQLRERIANESGLNLHAKRDQLTRTNPAATLRDAAVALGITVTQVEGVSAVAKSSLGEDTWKSLQKSLQKNAERTGVGLEFEEFFSKDAGGGGMRAVTPNAAVITGSVVAYDASLGVMYVHQHQKASGLVDQDKHRIYRVDYPQASLPVYNGAHLNGEPRMSDVEIGKTVRISYDPVSETKLEPVIAIVDKEIAKVASLERAEAIKVGQLAEKTSQQALMDVVLAKKEELLAGIAARALEGTPFQVRNLSLAPTDEKALNRGFLYPVRVGDHPLVVQVTHDGPGSTAQPREYRVYSNLDLFLRVSATDARGEQRDRGLFASIKVDNGLPTITNSLTTEQFKLREADLREQDAQRALDEQQARDERAPEFAERAM